MMVIQRPQLENADLTQYIPPQRDYETFRDVDHYKEKLKEWGLSSSKEAKKEFWYKERSYQRSVTIKGFETYGRAAEFNTLVVEFQDGNLSCIHPAYLKEMQQASFGKESMLKLEDREQEIHVENTAVDGSIENTVVEAPKHESKPEPKKPKREKPIKIDLPIDKVHFTAKVKQFALTYNPFNEENDEVVVLENVRIEKDPPLELGLAWCSHSKTLKKFELTAGNLLKFDGKVAAKKLAKGKDVEEEFLVDEAVLYKINNPSKIVKS